MVGLRRCAARVGNAVVEGDLVVEDTSDRAEYILRLIQIGSFRYAETLLVILRRSVRVLPVRRGLRRLKDVLRGHARGRGD